MRFYPRKSKVQVAGSQQLGVVLKKETKMRLSDAIALGRTLVTKPIAHYFYDPSTNCACARGMACLAVGATGGIGDVEKTIWPWLANNIVDPCQCKNYFSWRKESDVYGPVYSAINHLMYHVVGVRDGKPFPQTWTLDQLIDWVRSVEPNEETEAQEPISNTVAEKQAVL